MPRRQPSKLPFVRKRTSENFDYYNRRGRDACEAARVASEIRSEARKKQAGNPVRDMREPTKNFGRAGSKPLV